MGSLRPAHELESLAQEIELRSSFIRRMFGRYVSDDIGSERRSKYAIDSSSHV